jgi:hypothetical protein
MDIIKSSLVLLATLLLTACGGESDKSAPAEVIFPEHLPKVNPNLSQENQSGIWMVYRVTTESSEYTNDHGEIETIKKEIIANELGTMVFDIEYDDYYNALNCISSNFSLGPSFLAIDNHEQGYTELYRENMDEEYGSSGRITVSYLSSQKIYGKGWKIRQYLVDEVQTGFHQEIEFFAVKVSDEDNLSLSDDLDYFSIINAENNNFDEDQFYSGTCFGLQKHYYSSKVDNIETGSYTFQNFHHYGDYYRSFEIYNGKSKNSEEYEGSNNQVIGLIKGYDYIDNYCLSSDLECVNKYNFQSEILQNNSSGISFTAKLTGNEELNNEVYIDTQISIIIHPFEAAQDSQE